MELNTTINYDREHLRQFIIVYRNLPILWDAKSPNYSKKDKRSEAYQKLLHIFRKIRHDATIMDVKKKINSMRSNFRKEMKRVEESAAIGIQYRPSSWMYDELKFLNDSEVSHLCAYSSGETVSIVAVSDEEDSKNDIDVSHSIENDVSHSLENDVPLRYHSQYSAKPRYQVDVRHSVESDESLNYHKQYSAKNPTYSESNQDDISHAVESDVPTSYHKHYSGKKHRYAESNKDDISHSVESDVQITYQKQYSAKKSKHSESYQDDSPTSCTQYSEKRPAKISSDPSNCETLQQNRVVPTISYNDDLAKVWAIKLKDLAPLQRLFAEKAINDVLFEAQLGTLRRNSVKINIGGERTNIVIDNIRNSEPSQSSPEYKFSQTYGFAENGS